MSPPANPKILYRNSRLLRMVFLQLHRQQRADLFCDVVLQAEGEAIPAHCCILSACSPFFTERLEREMPPKGHKVVLEIRGLKIGTLRKLVDFLYTSEMEVSREEAQDILAAARQLQVSELESLQLEGGKLVKKSLGRRLNRDCLQLASPVSIPEASLVQSPPLCGTSSLASWLVAGKQHAVARFPSVTAEPLRTKGKKRPVGTGRNTLSNEESSRLRTQEIETGDKQAMASLQKSKKIKLSRPKPSSPPSPMPCTTKDCSAVASIKASSRSVRRLWRQKSPGQDETKGAKDGSYLHGFWSPPLLSKSTKSRKRNSSEPAPSSTAPQEAGQIGRVKLRKVINGSCWEVVQELPAAQLMRPANTVCAVKTKGCQTLSQGLEPEVADSQQVIGSAGLLPAKLETASCSEKNLAEQAENKMVLDEEDSAAGNPFGLNMFMLDPLAEVEQYDTLASAGELEHMLDLLLADDDGTGGPQGTTDAKSTAPGANKSPPRSTEAEEREKCPAEVSACPQLVKTGNSSLQGEQEETDRKISQGTCGSADEGPLLDAVCGSLPFVTSEPSCGSLALCRPPPPPLHDWGVPQPQLTVSENGTTRLEEPLPLTLRGDVDEGLLSYGAGFLDTESQPHTQAVLRSPLQHNLDSELPPLLASLEDEEIDVGGVEEPFVSTEWVRPDPSPVSETEVDVLS
uniref:BTB domain containing 18 n=1 Tax=Varanus komodoensis TaxID=61221 RepID=A0A8D2Q5W4_VARKO